MTYDQQIEVIQAAKDGKKIFGKRKGKEDWEYFDPRCTYRETFRSEKDVQFNFQEFEYKIK